jgi:hypothetical protein
VIALSLFVALRDIIRCHLAAAVMASITFAGGAPSSSSSSPSVPSGGGGGRNKRKREDESDTEHEVDEDSGDDDVVLVKTKSKKEVEVKADEVLYRKCLTKKHRQAFKSKVEPEISARNPKLKTGKGQSGQCWEIAGTTQRKAKGDPGLRTRSIWKEGS